MTIHPSKFKLGKLPARHDARVPRMSKHAKGLAAPPPFANWYAAVERWEMLANGPDVDLTPVGDCVVAAVMHSIYQERVYSGAGHARPPTGREALATYSAVGGYIPGDANTDQGLYMMGPGGMMDYWLKKGVMCGGAINTPAAFMAVTQPEPLEWQQAISVFGSLLIGIQLPESIVGAEEVPFIWNDTKGPIAGGHEVLLVGYQPSPDGNLYDLISWGAHYRATERFLFSRLDEAVAVVNSAFLDAEGHDPVGLHLPELLADMALLREE